MSILHSLEHRIAAIMSPIYANHQLLPRPLNTPAEIRLYLSEITQVEKNLRLLKTEVNDESRQVSMHYTDQAGHVSSHPIVGGIFGREEARHLSAHDRHHIQHNKHAALEHYHHATAHIDHYIAVLDNLKLQLRAAQPQVSFQPMPPPPQLLFNYTCQYCGYQFQTPGGLVRCPRCGR